MGYQPESMIFCLDFANTAQSYRETKAGIELQGYLDLVTWGVTTGVLTEKDGEALSVKGAAEPSRAKRTLEWARRLRCSIYQIFSAVASGEKPPPEALRHFNGELSLAMRQAQVLDLKDGFGWEWTDKTSALESVLWPVVRSAAELLTTGQLYRIRQCAGENCTRLFLDTSKNGKRRWCDMKGCGNRAKAKRHYQRKKSSRYIQA